MKRWLWLLVAAGVFASWRAVDAQQIGRRDGPVHRQQGNVMPQGAPAVPDASTFALFASGMAPVVLYAWKRHRAKK